MCLGSDGADGVRVPDDQVGVRAHSDPALPGVQVEDLSCVGAGHCHEHVLVHLTGSLGGQKKGKKAFVKKEMRCFFHLTCMLMFRLNIAQTD